MTSERWQEIKSVLAGALERMPGDRGAFLDRACADPSLRRDVESLIRAHEQAQSSLLQAPASGPDDPFLLKCGAMLGPYEILAPIGAGGMGQVYRARDTRLHRTVAIKVLPAHPADRPGVRERFEREAQTIAALNHPHVCSLYDVGHQNGIDFLVMEYLEGETLDQRLRKGPLPLPQLLQLAIEIAEALDKAHRSGITHRDLKPANVMLTKSGAKLLDFGLAKLIRETSPALSLSQLPTAEGQTLTAEGTILGTVQYMAPEQVEGKDADARTDIFALGAVIYEMATGKKAFEGETSAAVIARILETDPPPISSLSPAVPPALDHVVKRCMAKAPDERWQSAGDIANELRWIAEASSQPVSPSPAAASSLRARGRTAMLLIVGPLLVAAIVVLAIWGLRTSPPAVSAPVSRVAITLPPGQQLAGLGGFGLAIAVSPDGTHLAYIARQDGVQRLYLRPLEELEARPIPGSEGASEPFFSPDGEWLGFFADGELKKVSLTKGNLGNLLTVADAPDPRGASWGTQGTIVFAPTRASGIEEVSDVGGSPRVLTHAAEGVGSSHRWPELLPNGQAVLFAVGGSGLDWSKARVTVRSLLTGKRQELVQGTHPRYAPSGHLVFARDGRLMAAPFDPERLEVTGAVAPVLENVLQPPLTGAAQYSFSSTGTLVYVPADVSVTRRRLVWVSRNGEEQATAAPPRGYRVPRLSPDGRRVAVAVEDPLTRIWMGDLSRGTLTRLNVDAGPGGGAPAWTPDGKRIAFQGRSAGIVWQMTDGSGGFEVLGGSIESRTGYRPHSWSPDGQTLAITTMDQGIWLLHPGNRHATHWQSAPFKQRQPMFSPDGKWLAYTSDESGRFEIYVQAFPGPGEKVQISTEGGTEPTWNRNGRELFYRSGDKMIAVDVTTRPHFSVGRPRVLFTGQYERSPVPDTNDYDVTPDGRRFLMIKPGPGEDAPPTQINVVLNWFEELKQRVPTEAE